MADAPMSAQPHRKYLAIEFGGTHVCCAAVQGGEILEAVTLHTGAGALLADVLHKVLGHFRSFTQNHGNGFAGLGMGFCGLVDHRAGSISSTNGKYEDGTSIDLPHWTRRELGLPFRIENDVRLAILGEHYAGAARGTDNVALMTLGTGIGTAVIIEGKCLRGRHSQAGILGGHLKIPGSGRQCSCGGFGCYEAQASAFALPAVCTQWPGFENSSLRFVPKIDFPALFDRASAGDPVAVALRTLCLETWTACAISLVHAYDPDRLVIGGGLLQNSFPILQTIRQHLQNDSWTPWGTVDVVPMQHLRHAALLGVTPLFEQEA